MMRRALSTHQVVDERVTLINPYVDERVTLINP